MYCAGRTDKQLSGEHGEDQALQHLQRHGLTLLERNFRCKGGEIDLIMQSGADLVFVEVRKRKQSSAQGAIRRCRRQCHVGQATALDCGGAGLPQALPHAATLSF